jgi:hypothetical protein
MSALPIYDDFFESFSSSPFAAEPVPTVHSQVPGQRAAQPVIENLVTPVIPKWVLGLERCKRYSTMAASACVLALVPVYGLAVATQSHWSQGYQKLQELQRQEQQLIAARAQVRSQIVEKAQQQANLIPQLPATSVFLRPAPARPVAAHNLNTAELPTSALKPLSY